MIHEPVVGSVFHILFSVEIPRSRYFERIWNPLKPFHPIFLALYSNNPCMSFRYKTLVFASVLYMLLPALIFISGWVSAFPAGIFLCLGIFLIYSQTKHAQGKLCFGKKLHHRSLAIAILILFIWVLLAGIGGCWYQNGDFAFRNAMMGDLINKPWPVIFPDGKIFNYYFSSFLPAAFCGKFTGEFLGQKLMAVWSFIGIALCFLWFLSALKKNSIWLILLIFIFWSGLDIIAISAEKILGGSHNDYKVSGMTVNLLYGFQHAIPAFLWSACLLHPRVSNQMLVVIFAGLLYTSPLDAVGATPLLCGRILFPFHGLHLSWNSVRKRIKSIMTSPACWISLLFSFPALAFFANNDTTASAERMGWTWFYNQPLNIILVFACAIIPASVGYLSGKKSILYWISVALLILLPLYHVSGLVNDLVHKGAVPASFVLMYYFARSCMHASRTTRFWFWSYGLLSCLAALFALVDQISLGAVKKHSVPVPTVLRNDLNSSIYNLKNELWIYRPYTNDACKLPTWFYQHSGEAQDVWMKYLTLQQTADYEFDGTCPFFQPRRLWSFPVKWE